MPAPFAADREAAKRPVDVAVDDTDWTYASMSY